MGNAADRDELGEDGDDLDSMVRQCMQKFPDMSKGTATAHVLGTKQGAAVYARERTARLNKSIRG
jgi:hypothetical protein